MNILKRLRICLNGSEKDVFFGIPDQQEKIEMFRLRYTQYLNKNYIDPERFPDKLETDEYDVNNKCIYFIAKLDNKIIGSIRMICSDPLPIENDFIFNQPMDVKFYSKSQVVEFGRFIIIPPDKENGIYMPRGIIMLFLYSTIVDYTASTKNSIKIGYAFIKKSLEKKMLKHGFPFNYISPYKLNYPNNGILYKYFNQISDPVIPVYFIFEEFKIFVIKKLSNKLIFKKNDSTSYEFKNNLYTKVLKLINIL